MDIELGQIVQEPLKAPHPIDFTKEIVTNRHLLHPPPPKPSLADKFDIQITNVQSQAPVVTNLYQFVETSTGAFLLPLNSVTMSVNSNTTPITTAVAANKDIIANNLPETTQTTQKKNINDLNSEHCTCCVLLRKICKQRQTVITDYFSTIKSEYLCGCNKKKYPKVSNRLRLLVNNYKSNYTCALQALRMKMAHLKKGTKEDLRLNETNNSDFDDFGKFCFIICNQL